MALGNNQQSQSRIFLTVGFGKLRQKTLATGQKVDENTPNAVKRVTQQGADTWALEFDFITGRIESIQYKDNSATKFENSFDVLLRDGIDHYQISFTEDSKFWFGFMELLPNVNFNDDLTITVFDYVNKEKVRKSGINIEQFNNKNTREVTFKDSTIHPFIKSFYKDYQDNQWKFLNGYPAPSNSMNWKDKDDVKSYFISVKKFLRAEFARLIAGKFSKAEEKHENLPSEQNISENIPEGTDKDDLPL